MTYITLNAQCVHPMLVKKTQTQRKIAPSFGGDVQPALLKDPRVFFPKECKYGIFPDASGLAVKPLTRHPSLLVNLPGGEFRRNFYQVPSTSILPWLLLGIFRGKWGNFSAMYGKMANITNVL